MKFRNRLTLICLSLLLLSAACAMYGKTLKSEWADKSELTGYYTVIFYGANHYNDIATAAFLIPEESPYKFDIFAPDFNYTVSQGVPAKDALEAAARFVKWHPAYMDSHLSRILDPNGKVIGYEMRPFYRSTEFGKEDVMIIDYFQRGREIEVHVKVDPEIEKKFVTGDHSQNDQ
jgi:hypothetical protein